MPALVAFAHVAPSDSQSLHLPSFHVPPCTSCRHLERALGVAVCVPLSVMCSVGPGHQSWAPLVLASVAQVAQALVALSTGWHYDDDPSHAAYAAATVGIVVIFLAVEPMIIYFVRPGGTEAWWLWVVAGAARLWEACMRVAGAAGIGKIASLGTVTYGMLLSLLLIASGGAVIGFELMPWAALVLVLVSGERHLGGQRWRSCLFRPVRSERSSFAVPMRTHVAMCVPAAHRTSTTLDHFDHLDHPGPPPYSPQ